MSETTYRWFALSMAMVLTGLGLQHGEAWGVGFALVYAVLAHPRLIRDTDAERWLTWVRTRE